ncbi:NACHT domain-containing protein [Flavobacterium saccharophilum]|uniref:NACHT domain-containing protein n=1 Tax=Flavobacterium saccharophilum TaxID=29534 RepID=A0A1M7MCQ6_9FLAO|nr:NACHT domain-containing protein [Flavobacterium saccharophilum]SHM88121.1 NACHT domain-containing protein [Flavobacterium saccharophilum]
MIFTVTSIAFGTWLLEKIKDKGFDELYSELSTSDEINKAFVKAVDSVSAVLQHKHPNILGGRMEYFFKSENVFKELIKLTFINSTVNLDIIANSFDTDTLPPNFILEFIHELRQELLKDRQLSQIISNKELFILITGISNEVHSIAANSNLTLEEIKSIRGLMQQRIGNNFLLSDFLKKYAENAINNLSQINFLGLGVGADISKKINRKNLEDIFVKPNFKINENKYLKSNEQLHLKLAYHDFEINYSDIFNSCNKMVILGNPGSGKSLLIKSIICSILDNKSDFKNKDIIKYIPFRIELRKYLAYKKQHRGNIIKYLNSLLEEEYAITQMTEILLEKILHENKNIIFFDGLDEIFKIEDKIEIKNDIENFHTSFPLSNLIVTSRIIGYEEAKLNEEEFVELNIQNFKDDQIEEYLKKWYEKEEDVEERRNDEIYGFLDKKHEIDRELVSNPLLLSLIVIIYRNTLALPDSKLEIYQSCTKTLVEKWDASKKDFEINLDQIIYKKRENILADLAFWQYQELSGDEIKITFEKVLSNVAASLERLKIVDETESYNFAEQFMNYAQKRSIYFENNFTHKTFLEYYSAYWIYSNIEKKNKTVERNLIIAKYIDNSFWHIVLELLLNMIDKNQADNEMMDELINFQIKEDVKSLPFILSTIDSYKNVSKECIANSINTAIDFLLSDHNSNNFSHKDNFHFKVFEAIKNLLAIGKLSSHILEKLIQIEESGQNIDLLYALYYEIDLINTDTDKDSVFRLKNRELLDITINNNKFLYISSCYNIRAKENRENYFQTVDYFLTQFGVENFFLAIPFYFSDNSYLPMIYYYLREQIKQDNIFDISKNLEFLFEKGVQVDDIIDFLSSSDLHYSTQSLNESILQVFDNDDNQIINLILLLILFTSRYDTTKIKEWSIGKKKEHIILKIDSIPMDDRVSEIFKIFNYTKMK